MAIVLHQCYTDSPLFYCYAESRYAECHYAECYCAHSGQEVNEKIKINNYSFYPFLKTSMQHFTLMISGQYYK
jgi:hypothetical protein